MSRRRRIADVSAGLLAVAVLSLGGLIVVKPAIDHWDDLYRGDPFEVGAVTQTVKKQRAGEPGETTTTRTEASASSVERALGKSGLVLLRVALVALAAFLAAAVLQRAILGSFGLRGTAVEPSTPAAASDHAAGFAVQAQDASAAAPARPPSGSNGDHEPAGGNLPSAVATLVASRREAMGLSQRELAKRAGVSHTVISRIENGQHAPSAKTVERLADALR